MTQDYGLAAHVSAKEEQDSRLGAALMEVLALPEMAQDGLTEFTVALPDESRFRLRATRRDSEIRVTPVLFPAAKRSPAAIHARGGIVDLRGCCPVGCGSTLHLMPGGLIACLGENCPDPTAVQLLLLDCETEHIVVFTDSGFTIRHPLRERLDDALLTCALQEYTSSFMAAAAVRPGKYRAVLKGGLWSWEELPPRHPPRLTTGPRRTICTITRTTPWSARPAPARASRRPS